MKRRCLLKRKSQTDVPTKNPAPKKVKKKQKSLTIQNNVNHDQKIIESLHYFHIIFYFSFYKFVNKVLNPIHILLIANPYTYTDGMFSIIKNHIAQ